MAEYIEREKVLEIFDEWIETTGVLPKGTSYYYECRGCIEDAPAADVVQVVRCKDCKHWDGVTFGNVCRHFSGLNTKICTNENEFCSFAVRKDGGEYSG